MLRSAAFTATALLCAGNPARAAWRPTGPFGGEAELVRVAPRARNLVVAGTHSGLIYQSSNGGAFWTSVSFPPQSAATLHALEVDPQDEHTWYAGVESDTQWLAGIWKTTDSGKTWLLLPETKGMAVWSLAIWSGDSKIIAAGTGTGVFRSEDRGQSWKRISPVENTDLKPVVSLAFNPSDNKVLFAGTTHLPWRTKDGGKTWTSIHEGMLDDSDVFSIQVDALKPGRIFASACSGVYTSADEGGRWNKLNTPKGAFRTYFVAIEPKKSDTVFAGTTEGLLRSVDGGRNWRLVSPEAVRSMAFDPFVPGRLFFASSSAGLMVSTDDGVTVKESNFGFTNRNFTTLTGAGAQLYSSSVYEPVSGGVYRTANLGLRWTRSGEPRPDQLLTMAASPENADTLLAAGYRGLLQSVDGGKTWTAISGPAGNHIAGIVALPKGIYVAATEQGLFRSAGTASWVQTAPVKADALNVSGGMPYAVSSNAAYVSPDQGATWRQCGNPTTPVNWYGLAFDAGSPDTALAATSAGPFRSTDGCKTWTQLRDGLRAETASLVLFHPTRQGEAYLVQGGRVFRSIDGGQRWSPLDDDAQYAEARSVMGPSSLYVLPSAPDRLFALFPRRGVFSTTIDKEKTLQ